MQKLLSALFLFSIAVALVSCSSAPPKSPAVSDDIRKSLDQVGLKDVKVDQDRDKGVITLTGHVPSEADKSKAEGIAKSYAASQVVSDQIAVLPLGAESDTKTVNSDLDKGIGKNLDAALVQNRLKKGVKFDVKNGVVTLMGDVNSQSRRAQVEKVASTIPHVQQVVNELQIKVQKATSSN
jgi:hyperosmotically inducible periplasmic protein